MAKIKNVVFDLGGVLIEWDPRYLYRKLLPDEKAVDHFLQGNLQSGMKSQARLRTHHC